MFMRISRVMSCSLGSGIKFILTRTAISGDGLFVMRTSGVRRVTRRSVPQGKPESRNHCRSRAGAEFGLAV